jgi:hypothetical protein
MSTADPKILFVQQEIEGEEFLEQLGIRSEGQPVIFLIAGAKFASPENQTAVRQCVERIGETAKNLDAIVIDGGTNYGPMGMLNDSLASLGFTGTYIGLLPAFSVQHPNEAATEMLGGHHSHIVLVEGKDYGDECRPMFALIHALSQTGAAAGVVVNGGERAREEVVTAIGLGLPLVVVKGSGRLADELAHPKKGGVLLSKQRSIELHEAGFITVVDGVNQPGAAARTLEVLLHIT